MPDSNGLSLPSEDRKWRLDYSKEKCPQYQKRRESIADWLLNYGLSGLRGDTKGAAIESHVFAISNKNFAQAIECFRHESFEASMVMARTTIDAALYESRYTTLQEIKGYDTPFGGSVSTGMPLGRTGRWQTLKKELKKLYTNPKDIRRIEHIRDRYCNFSAHNIAAYMVEMQEYQNLSEEERKRAKRPMLFISQVVTQQILKDTAKFLLRVRKEYLKKNRDKLA